MGVDPAMKNEIAFEDDARANEAYCDVLASPTSTRSPNWMDGVFGLFD